RHAVDHLVGGELVPAAREGGDGARGRRVRRRRRQPGAARRRWLQLYEAALRHGSIERDGERPALAQALRARAAGHVIGVQRIEGKNGLVSEPETALGDL